MSRAGLAARLCEALRGEEAPVVEALLKQGADPNLVLPEGIAAIHLAAGKERESGVRCLKLILQYGGNPNARSVEELTPLHVAASWGCYKCLKLLLRNGGDPNLEDQDGNRAIDLALEQGNKMCVQILQGFQYAWLPEKADGAHKHTFCHEGLRNAESFLSVLTDDCTETGLISRLSEAWDDPGPLSSTQKCLPDGSPSNAGLGITVNNAAAADASGQLSCIPGNLQDNPCCSVPPSTLAFCAYSHPGRSQGPATLSDNGPCSRRGLPQPVLSSTWLSASNEPRELTSSLTTTPGFPGDETSASPSSETDDSLTPPGPGYEDTTDSGHGLSSQPVPCQDESISKESVISQSQRCSMSHAAQARRSVSFCESPKIFPLRNNGNWKERPSGPRCNPRVSAANGTLGQSQLSDFLDLEMLGKVNGQEGLDVTSPDHVYLFCRANSTAVCDLEKTVMDPTFLARTHENSDSPFATGQVLSRSSESGSSQYSSCDSDCYVSAADASDHSEPKKCLEGNEGCTGGDTQCCSSLCAGDASADSNSAGSKDGSSRVHLGKGLVASTAGQSCEKLVEMPSAVETVMQHVPPSGSQNTEMAGRRHLYASSEASHISRDGSGLTSAGKPASELCICGTAHKSLKDTGVSSPSQELQAECVSHKQNDRDSSILSTQEPHQLTPADDVVEEAGPQEASASVNYRQIIADWKLQGKLKRMLLSTDNSLSARTGLTSSQWVARKADIQEWDPSANEFDPEMPDTVLLGGATSGTPDIGMPSGDMEENNTEEEINGNPFRGRSVKPPSLSSEADTLVIQHIASPADGSGEDEFTHLNEKQKMFPTSSDVSPLLQMRPRPCHVTPRTKSRLASAARDSISSSSLFEETLEMPRRPRRIRSPPGMRWMPVGPAACLEGNTARASCVAQGGENASCWEAEETNDLDDTELIIKAISHLGSSAGHSSYPHASPTVLLDSDKGTDEQSFSGNKGKAEPGAACHPGLPPCLPSFDTDNPPPDSMWLTEDGESDCTDPTRQVALTRPLDATAFSQAESDAANEECGSVLPSACLQEEHRQPQLDAKRQPGGSRVSFSRLSSRRPSRATSATDHTSGRLSPVLDSCSQDFPLSPGGRPMNLSTREPVEYLYMDEEEGYALIERHVPCMDNASVLIDTTSSDDTIVYDWKAYQSKLAEQENKENQPLQCKSPMATSKLHLLSDEALIRKLRNLGTNPGPITSRTRKFYLELLDKLLKDPNSQARKRSVGHSPELASVLETFQIPDCKDDEMTLSRQFDQPDKNRKWREGVLKSSFNYLLLDPRVTQNLPFRCHRLSQADCFRTFISAVFYVGKGKRSRPYSHLYQALTHYRGGKKQACPKVQHILDIWAGGQGVISVHCFQNVIPVEAYTREACLVDAIGLKMLTNQKKGNYYGVVASWAMKRRRCLGIHMLHRAMQIFLAEGERQLRPADIQIGQ
ncbi:ankyrin repeat and LEM domain-containing protein 1 [Gopherus flavomarginatus]|uniref:ankyrin repeat and LEM domain-containing protein 1 n=1 Tax=Gopherus flavomarginatus TaxID=286002 RepID=UPI0021CC0269|nr:ankyrin repeat and LEM domain-containing protein 1 [Gopherus flavomarginatus]